MKHSLLPAALLLAVTASYGGDAGTSKHGWTKYYRVDHLPSDGTPNRGNGINNRGWVAGYSTVPESGLRHATVWINGTKHDLGTLGGPRATSSVVWPVKGNSGLVVGISYTDIPDPNEEAWSCAQFIAREPIKYTCVGFAWQNGQMRALKTLGGYNGFATGANNRGEIVGWAETAFEDPTCTRPLQKLQFLPAVWGPGRNQVRALPLLTGDSSGAATALNDRGQVVGISGECNNAVGRLSAKHAVLWDDGKAIDIGNLGVEAWVTPMAINQRGDIVGFAPIPDGNPADDLDNPTLRAFLRTRNGKMENIGLLDGHVFSQALGINEWRQVVGVSCPAAPGLCRGFLYENGVMTDLNELRETGYSGHIESAQDINDLGKITGRTLNPDTTVRSAYVASPRFKKRDR